MSALPSKADIVLLARRPTWVKRTRSYLLRCLSLADRQHSLIGFHDAALPFACAHLVGCDAVLIVLNGAFVVAACVLMQLLCRACREQACPCHPSWPSLQNEFSLLSPRPCNFEND
jgi:hypothetical protein